MENHTCTTGGHTYRLVYTGRTGQGGRHDYRLQAPGDGRPLAVVVRCWINQPGAGAYGLDLPQWGWEWRGRWFPETEQLIAAVVAAQEASAA
jgi:hypothetical protein